MDILKKFVLLTITIAIMAGLFFVGIAFFTIVLILFPIVYFYQKYKRKGFMFDLAQAEAAMKARNAHNEQNNQNEISDSKVIEAEFEVIEEEKK